MGELWLLRHGETAWSKTGQHTGRTDLPLLPEGEQAATALKPRLDRPWTLVLSSPLQRAWRTAELAGLRPEAEPDLMEWDYGAAEGIRTQDMGPGWRVWEARDLGETLEQVADRVRRVLARVPADGDTLLVAHGHVLRILTAVFLGLSPREAQHFVLKPTGLAILGREHEWPALKGWNL